MGGNVFVLDMGEPVKINELATKMIHLMGFEVKNKNTPDGDIEIQYTGLRPGEKLYEELLIGDNVTGTLHPRIMQAEEEAYTWDEVINHVHKLMKEKAFKIIEENSGRIKKWTREELHER